MENGSLQTLLDAKIAIELGISVMWILNGEAGCYMVSSAMESQVY